VRFLDFSWLSKDGPISIIEILCCSRHFQRRNITWCLLLLNLLQHQGREIQATGFHCVTERITRPRGAGPKLGLINWEGCYRKGIRHKIGGWSFLVGLATQVRLCRQHPPLAPAKSRNMTSHNKGVRGLCPVGALTCLRQTVGWVTQTDCSTTLCKGKALCLWRWKAW